MNKQKTKIQSIQRNTIACFFLEVCRWNAVMENKLLNKAHVIEQIPNRSPTKSGKFLKLFFF